MKVERTDKEILIRLPLETDVKEVQLLIDRLIFKKIISKSKATEEAIEQLATASKENWWKTNENSLLK